MLKQKPSKRIHKQRHLMKSGPLDGHSLYLETPGTLTFTMKGQTGFYNFNDKWVVKYDAKIK